MQRQMAKLEKDTYAVRKAEGRPKHGQTSFTILGVGSLAWFCLIIAICLPEWRSNWIGMLGYPHKRGWGLFSVVGMTSKMHHEAMTDQCRFYSQLNVGGICASPVCLWYRMKCQVYMDISMVSYTTAFFFFLCLILNTLSLVWTARMTPRMIRWAAIWWVAQIIIHISVMMFWWLMTGESFNSLDTESLYPEPDFSFCFYLECLAIMCLCVCSTMAITLMKMWPEESSSGSDETDSEDESDEGGPPPAGMPPGGMPPPGYPGGPPPPGWDPNMGPPPMMGPGGPPPPGMMGPGGPPPPGMMGPGGPPPPGYQGGPPPGYDPNLGPPPPGYDPNLGPPPPGYDPNMGPPPMGGPPGPQYGGPPPGGPPPGQAPF